MGSIFGGGGGGGSAPAPPKLKQINTSLTGPLYTTAAKAGDQWANLMRANYGLGPAGPGAPASWQAKYLGPGALAMMKQSGLPFAGKQDPQVTGTLTTAFGAPSGGGEWNLGGDPFTMGANLGQQFRNPLGQLERNQGFVGSLEKQWQPPNLRLTGEDLANVKMQQMTQNAQAQQQAFEAALQGQNLASSSQAAASAAEIGALGKLGGAGITAFTSPSLSSSGYYQPSPFGAIFGGGVPSGATDAFSGITYGAGTDVSGALGPAAESAGLTGGTTG
ncbi:MAG: hypothetical protein C5B54_00485 [Acidobacteria bacterium]|nr:MAG: hypothetical protein C5B54_00485 [Acidobacteriota bacterium]